MRRAFQVILSEAQRHELLIGSRSHTLPARQVSGARILLLAADGAEDLAVAAKLGCGRQRCARIRRRFLADGLEGICRDATRSGRPRKHDAQRIVALTTALSRRRPRTGAAP